jgi:hypothetical protein
MGVSVKMGISIQLGGNFSKRALYQLGCPRVI